MRGNAWIKTRDFSGVPNFVQAFYMGLGLGDQGVVVALLLGVLECLVIHFVGPFVVAAFECLVPRIDIPLPEAILSPKVEQGHNREKDDRYKKHRFEMSGIYGVFFRRFFFAFTTSHFFGPLLVQRYV
jgi:hypothetical protein